MPSSARPIPSRDKVRDYRARMRAKGMKLIQFWVPDTNSAAFKAEARRDSLLIANSPWDGDDQAFVDSISEF